MRTRHLPDSDIVVHSNIPITSPARTICDMASRVTVHGLTNMMHEAEFRNCFSAEDIVATAERLRKRPNSARITRALNLHAEGGAGTTNVSEDRFLELVDEAGIPEPWVGRWVSGRIDRYRLDTYWPAVGWNCEVDGGPHSRKGSQRTDADRDADLTDTGIRIHRFPTALIWADPAWVVRCLQRAWSELCAQRMLPATHDMSVDAFYAHHVCNLRPVG